MNLGQAMRVMKPLQKDKVVWTNRPRLHLGDKVTEKGVVGVLEMNEDSLCLSGKKTLSWVHGVPLES